MFLLVGKGEIFGFNQVCLFGLTLFTKPGRKYGSASSTRKGLARSSYVARKQFRVTDCARSDACVTVLSRKGILQRLMKVCSSLS